MSNFMVPRSFSSVSLQVNMIPLFSSCCFFPHCYTECRCGSLRSNSGQWACESFGSHESYHRGSPETPMLISGDLIGSEAQGRVQQGRMIKTCACWRMMFMQCPGLLTGELADVVQVLLSGFQDLQLASVICTDAKVCADGGVWTILAYHGKEIECPLDFTYPDGRDKLSWFTITNSSHPYTNPSNFH